VAISIGGVVLSVFLIFTLTGVYIAMDSVMDKVVEGAGADLWITSKGSSGSLHSPSLLPTNLSQNLTRIEGIQDVSPYIRYGVLTNIGGEKFLIILNGFDTRTNLGGPWNVIKGATKPQNGEIIIDKALSSKADLGVGSTIKIGESVFKIVGLSDQTNILIGYMAFITFDDAREYLPGNITNSFLIKVNQSSQILTVKKAIEATLPDVGVWTNKELSDVSKSEVLGSFVPIVSILDIVGIFVGVLVVGLLVYTMTIEKSKEYGILKAVGATNLYLYRSVLAQALILSIAGFFVGAALTVVGISAIIYFVPTFLVELTPAIFAWGFLIFIVTGVLASLIPVRRLIRIDPAIVFKG
jgi:putative ABC transport system permease protein